MIDASSSNLESVYGTNEIEQHVADLEPFAPLVLGIHGVIMLLFIGGIIWQWMGLTIIILLGVWGLSRWGKSKQANLIRAGLIFVIAWLLMFSSGGVNSFFLLWYFILLTVYPNLLPTPYAITLIIGVPLSYFLLWPFSVPSTPLFIVVARTFLLGCLGWLVWALGTTVMRYALRYQRREKQLRRHERHLYQVIQGMPVMVNAFDEAFNIVIWNHECERVTGYSAAEMIGNPHGFELLYPDPQYRDWVKREWQKQGGCFRRWILDVSTKDGLVKQVAWSNTGQEFSLAGGSVWSVGVDVTNELQAEAEVYQSAQLLKTITDNFPYAYLAIINNDWTVGLASGQEFKMQQLNPQNFVGLTVYEIFNGYGTDVLAEIIERFKKTFTGKTQTFEVAVEDQYLLINTAPLADAQGFVQQILAVVQNITERKQAELEFQTVQARLQGIIESAMDAIITVDTQQRIVLFNQAAEQLFGLSAAAAIGQSLDHFIPERFRTVHSQHVKHFAQSGITSRRMGHLVDVTGLRVNGEEFPIEASISQIIVRGQQLLTVILRDISERKAAVARIRYQAHLLANVQDAIIATDTEFNITAWNKGAESLYGWSEREVLGKNVSTVLRSELSAEQRAESIRQLNQHGQYRTEVEQHHRNGQPLQVEGVTMTLNNDDGRLMGYIAVNRNITERKELENRLLQAQKMEAVGHLAGGIAHDFNNLLVPIIGYTELSMAKLETDNKLYTNLSQIKRAADRASDLIRQILAFSRKQVLTMQILDLNAIAADFQKMIQRLIGENIEFHSVLNPSWFPIKADKTQIEQVLMNLAVNARDAMPRGGKLTLKTANIYIDENYRKKHPTTELWGSYALLSFGDTGYGMDEKTQRQIFEPFFTTKERGKGTGLGLATVFGIVQQHQGHIEVESQLGRGTTFKIYLPHIQDNIPLHQRISEIPESVYGSETIMVVEDEEMVRKLVCETLEGFGYHILQAEDPVTCLSILQQHKGELHLLLTDVVMPQMNGQELYQEITKKYPDCQILYMSGYTDDTAIVDSTLFNENQNFLQKPFPLSMLAQKVREALD